MTRLLPTTPGSRRTTATALLAAGLLVGLAGCSGDVPDAVRATPTAAVSSGPTASAPPPPATTAGTPSATVTPSPPARSRPVHLSIPRIGVSTSLEDLHLDRSGVLLPPHDPARAGWFVGGPVPGELGPSVIAGHVDSLHGPAVFYRLRQLRTGDRLAVRSSDGTTTAFRVVEVEHADKASFPTQDVYGPTPDRELRLITCGGQYVKRSGGYQQNVLVYAIAA